MIEPQPLTWDEAFNAFSSNIGINPNKQCSFACDNVLSALKGLKEHVNTHRGIQRADKVMFNCFIDKWFPILNSDEQTKTSGDLQDTDKVGGSEIDEHFIYCIKCRKKMPGYTGDEWYNCTCMECLSQPSLTASPEREEGSGQSADAGELSSSLPPSESSAKGETDVKHSPRKRRGKKQ